MSLQAYETLSQGTDDEFGSRGEDQPLVVHMCSSTLLKSMQSLGLERTFIQSTAPCIWRITSVVIWLTRRGGSGGTASDGAVMLGLSLSGFWDSDSEMLRVTVGKLTGLNYLDICECQRGAARCRAAGLRELTFDVEVREV